MSGKVFNGHVRGAGPLVVVGDALLDVDILGSADRLCPDAPVPVVECHEHWYRAGGAGLAALLAATGGHDVVFVSAVADDAGGERLRGLLRDRLDLLPLPMSGTTQIKKRVWGNGQVLLRLDEGNGRAAVDDPDSRLSAPARTALRSARAVLVSDYGRGMATHPGIRELLAARPPGTPLVWDPHPRGAAPTAGADMVTPNESEAVLLAQGAFPGAGGDPGRDPQPEHGEPLGTGAEPPHDTPLEGIARRSVHLREYWKSNAVAVTAASRGVVLADGTTPPRHLPSPRVLTNEDVCGAGDSFAATITAALGDGMARTDAVRAAVDTASRFVGAGGAMGAAADECSTGGDITASPGHDDPLGLVETVRARGGRVVATGGCFDVLHAGHVGLLRRARTLGDALVVCVNDDESVRRLKGAGRPVMPARDRVQLLEALECVDAVLLFSQETPVGLLHRIRPDVWVKGCDYEGRYLPETRVVRRYGGEVVLLPRLERRSTTALVSAIRAGN